MIILQRSNGLFYCGERGERAVWSTEYPDAKQFNDDNRAIGLATVTADAEDTDINVIRDYGTTNADTFYTAYAD